MTESNTLNRMTQSQNTPLSFERKGVSKKKHIRFTLIELLVVP